MKTYKIYTLGCKVNQYDAGKLACQLDNSGLAPADKNADIAIINSCAVTKNAIIKSRRMVKSAKKANPKAKIALAGCWPKIGADQKNMPCADLIIRTDDFKELLKIIPNFKNRGDGMIVNNKKARYFIKIQDGCEQFCSYCVIPYARGKLKSRGEREIIREIGQAVKAGYGEIVISGIHLGLYGYSVMPGLTRHPERMAVERNLDSRLRGNDSTNLAGLIKKIIEIKNLGRIRLSSIEITEVSDELIGLMAKSKKICRHLHLPLQSGCDKILKLMNRPYNAEYFKNRIKKIRKAMPDIAISSDIIIGFPGETEKDFKAVEKFIKQMKFSRLHVFPFSAHEKTPAAKMPNQIEEKIKALRAGILRKLGARLEEDYKNKFIGKELDVAVENIRGGKHIGKTEYYFDIIFNSDQISGEKINKNNSLIRKIVKVKN
ncbi:MAG: MiaB/RimO family radical SAM methylthiotransferase [bacterium]